MPAAIVLGSPRSASPTLWRDPGAVPQEGVLITDSGSGTVHRFEGWYLVYPQTHPTHRGSQAPELGRDVSRVGQLQPAFCLGGGCSSAALTAFGHSIRQNVLEVEGRGD